jgi:hypothetical protein
MSIRLSVSTCGASVSPTPKPAAAISIRVGKVPAGKERVLSAPRHALRALGPGRQRVPDYKGRGAR